MRICAPVSRPNFDLCRSYGLNRNTVVDRMIQVEVSGHGHLWDASSNRLEKTLNFTAKCSSSFQKPTKTSNECFSGAPRWQVQMLLPFASSFLSPLLIREGWMLFGTFIIIIVLLLGSVSAAIRRRASISREPSCSSSTRFKSSFCLSSTRLFLNSKYYSKYP